MRRRSHDGTQHRRDIDRAACIEPHQRNLGQAAKRRVGNDAKCRERQSVGCGNVGSNVRFSVDRERGCRGMQRALRVGIRDRVVGTGKIADGRPVETLGQARSPRGIARTVPAGRVNAAADDPRSRTQTGGESTGDAKAYDRFRARCDGIVELAREALPIDAAGDASHTRSRGNPRFEREPARDQDEAVMGLRLRGRRAHIPSRILGSDEDRCAR